MNKDAVSKYYDNYAEKQLSKVSNDRHRKIREYAVRFGLKESDHVLEIGCGIGAVTALLSEIIRQGHITAIDISPKSIEIAEERLKHFTNIEFLVGDVIEMNIGGRFDFIILPDVIEHIPLTEHPSLFRKLRTLIKDTGAILINIPNPYYLEWCRMHRKDLLQLIDQPIYTNELAQNIYRHGLYIYYLETYSIWVLNNDYQVIVLKPVIKELEYPDIQYKLTLIQKMKFRLRKLWLP